MGTWISHLRIAEALLPQLPGIEPTAFIYGNLAPDSGLPNADWTVFDPPKTVTHFLREGEGENAIRDYHFYQQYLAPLDPHADLPQYSFRLGYFFHLICDNLWSKKIADPTRVAFEAEIKSNRTQMWDTIKNDWYGLDHRYIQSHPEHIFWRVMMTTPNPPSALPFLSEPALHQQLDYIRNFYSQPQPEWLVTRPFPYLSEHTMDRLVTDSVTLIRRIWEKHPQLAEMQIGETTLTLFSSELLAPYAMPLGDKGAE